MTQIHEAKKKPKREGPLRTVFTQVGRGMGDVNPQRQKTCQFCNEAVYQSSRISSVKSARRMICSSS
ncbi:hypothetical protein F441_12476 [Phytophthora nicotianae CJ01A1]|uniref:Uncharacterized protein n=4 Tax=Phytophthora nicotianae TaxID=4792 RepID=V9ESS7_PHYNI|nr:hypothetical protein F443_12516 [Phytophthora nicotianae P1569]ETK82378.1 hypothetical protein L915_12227 [Phytophthora nicotianae]ETP12089.1 hypothetical protein F441_12476 [Phytophthora nicotianae CJ01A1]ETP40212.1 hypothetical protein F442_12427 [Phytophthora nicotianae P10297]ETL35768.1 hypothetical protein L916_12148 [Phytophthora nicotianae]